MMKAKAIKPKAHYRAKDNATGYLLLAPWLVGFLLMWLIPAVMSIYYSFTNYNLLSAPKWVGLQNYVTILTTDKNFRQALTVTFAYVFVMVPLRLAFALFVANLLNKKHMGMAMYRVLYYVPSIIGGSIAVSVVWKQIYHIRVTLNFTGRTISFTVTDAADPSKSQTVSDLPMDPTVDYADNVGALVFSHYFRSAASWTTSIDNFSVYGTSVAPASIEYTVDCVNLNAVDGIKLVPVEGALSATAKLFPTVYPTAADQTVTYTVSDELKDWITVDNEGTIAIHEGKFVEYGKADSVETVNGSIRIQSAVDETIFQDVKVLVGPPNTNEKLTLTVNGTEYSETAMQFPVGQAVDLGFAATGGDGNSDLFRYKWTIAENTAGAILDGNTLTAKQEGTVTLNFVIDFFRGETTRTIELVFTDKAEPPVDPDEPDSPEEGGDPSDPEQPTPAEPQQPDQGDSGQTTSRPDDKKAVTAQNVSEISEPTPSRSLLRSRRRRIHSHWGSVFS